jgi:hypothetical protein
MAEIKLLNLDDLAVDASVQILLNGKKHTLTEMTVENFVWTQKEMTRLQAVKDPIESFEMLIGVLARQFPTVDLAELRQLSLTKLHALMDFVNELSKNGAESALKQVEGSGDEANPPGAAQAA